jgi:hypothetical protein
VEGSLVDARAVAAGEIVGLTATIQGGERRYGEAYHVTFPATRDLDLWVAAVVEAWSEAQASRAALAEELPDWMRPSKERMRGELIAVVSGRLRCGRPVPPLGLRPATVLAERVRVPGLDAAVLCRAEELWRRARQRRARSKDGR